MGQVQKKLKSLAPEKEGNLSVKLHEDVLVYLAEPSSPHMAEFNFINISYKTFIIKTLYISLYISRGYKTITFH